MHAWFIEGDRIESNLTVNVVDFGHDLSVLIDQQEGKVAALELAVGKFLRGTERYGREVRVDREIKT